jgi:uncharacterized protein YigE (DUF2233 family)
MEEVEPGRIRAVVELNLTVGHKVFDLKGPNRLVIDLLKVYEHKNEKPVAPGLKLISWQRAQGSGPVQANILVLEPGAGLAIQPVLSNGAIAGLEPLAAMSARAKAVAAVNGSYFAPNGEIIGLLKIDGEIISTPTIPRTAVGVMPDGSIIFDQVAYQGNLVLSDGRSLAISGLNRSRGDNEIILYTGYYGPRTGTNNFGIEYTVNSEGVVTALATGNAPIDPGAVVVSAHGNAAKVLSGIKVGERITINHTLGPVWDKTVHALGAGPMLVKDGSIFLTTKTEDFGSDVAGGRAPRTALGLTKEGKLLLVVVDGRQAGSTGMTLLELAMFMQELGAVDAMNLDGGGSSEMIVFDSVVNKPSDGRVRKLGDALAVVSSKLAN